LSFTEDCVQECLIAIHLGRHTFDPKRSFRPWLFTIVRNKTVDLLRRSYAGDSPANEPLSDELPAGDVSPADTFAGGEILAELQPQFRNALTLTKVFGYSVAEAAAHTGISVSAMKSRVSRAIRAAEVLLGRESNCG
jgi:RNA polymerase sigma-70 factor (ECF subfamily)